mmetsp:Transcript_40736/g.129980  ORF Transcript_40736/g.129980 Transcript_40736/m.129980 type:complete len:356 (+) Transcript_40736:77-1144(+)
MRITARIPSRMVRFRRTSTGAERKPSIPLLAPPAPSERSEEAFSWLRSGPDKGLVGNVGGCRRLSPPCSSSRSPSESSESSRVDASVGVQSLDRQLPRPAGSWGSTWERSPVASAARSTTATICGASAARKNSSRWGATMPAWKPPSRSSARSLTIESLMAAPSSCSAHCSIRALSSRAAGPGSCRTGMSADTTALTSAEPPAPGRDGMPSSLSEPPPRRRMRRHSTLASGDADLGTWSMEAWRPPPMGTRRDSSSGTEVLTSWSCTTLRNATTVSLPSWYPLDITLTTPPADASSTRGEASISPSCPPPHQAAPAEPAAPGAPSSSISPPTSDRLSSSKSTVPSGVRLILMFPV